ncbi:hypothetical protein ACSVHC_18090 [Arthrobacter sp. KNU-44]|uniref:hypothetical protein n=1 Tax=Arthrobacter sp. KNU-44 TaxID=3450744 RepID=UPI003F4411D0
MSRHSGLSAVRSRAALNRIISRSRKRREGSMDNRQPRPAVDLRTLTTALGGVIVFADLAPATVTPVAIRTMLESHSSYLPS